MEIRDIKLVVAIAQAGSMSAAAGRLNLSQSALSHHLRKLEDLLGVTLFTRTGKALQPTAAGKVLASSGLELLSKVEDLRRVVTQDEHEYQQVRISTECVTCYGWLPACVRHLSEMNKKLGITIAVEATRRPLQALRNGEIDIALVTTNPRDRAFSSVPLFADEFVAVVPSTHRLAQKSSLVPKDFEDEQLLLFSPLKESFIYHKFLKPAGIEPARATAIGLTEAALELTSNGFGISFMPAWLLANECKTRNVSIVRLAPILSRRWYLVTRKSGFGRSQLQHLAAGLRAGAAARNVA